MRCAVANCYLLKGLSCKLKPGINFSSGSY